MNKLGRNLDYAIKAVFGRALAPLAAALFLAPVSAHANEDLAQQTQNPVAALISVPVRLAYDTGIGPADADRATLKVQPVIPFDLSPEWNLISRTIVPIVNLESPVRGGNDLFGLGDITQSFFFSPKAPTSGGWIWGAGPILLLPAGKEEFSTDNWGIGPTFVALKQQNGWTYGGLFNHVWGLTNPSGGRDKTDSTFLQPFVSYTTADAWSFGANTEATYDWNEEQWTAPLNLTVDKVTKLGSQLVSLRGGVQYFYERPSGGPDWGVTVGVTFLFPK